MELNLNLPYNVPVDENAPAGQETPSPSDMTEDYINYAVNSVYKEGLDGQKRRIWSRIKTKISKAVEGDAENVILEAAEVDFLKDAFAKSKCPPSIAPYYVVLEDAITSLK